MFTVFRAARDCARGDRVRLTRSCVAIATALWLTALAAAAVRAAPAQASGSISAQVVSLRNDRGRVVCSLFVPNGGFPSDGDKAIRQVSVPIKQQTATCNFTDVPAGTYAITVFHDENANGSFDMNWLGLPEEGYGFSNDARAVLAPPSFSAASFQCDSGGTRHLTIHIRY